MTRGSSPPPELERAAAPPRPTNGGPRRWARGRAGALVSLALLAPVPSLAVVSAMVVSPGEAGGRLLFAAAKAWIVLLPAVWFLAVERERPSWSPTDRRGLRFGLLLGLAMAATIAAAAWLAIGPGFDAEPLRKAAVDMGLSSPSRYLLAAFGWIAVNSVVEEYVYRWFVLRQCSRLMPGGLAAVASALVFTAHHVLALRVYLDPVLTAVGSAGVFAAGILWAWCYRRYRSIWPCWVSHAVADVAVFAVGWLLLFG